MEGERWAPPSLVSCLIDKPGRLVGDEAEAALRADYHPHHPHLFLQPPGWASVCLFVCEKEKSNTNGCVFMTFWRICQQCKIRFSSSLMISHTSSFYLSSFFFEFQESHWNTEEGKVLPCIMKKKHKLYHSYRDVQTNNLQQLWGHRVHMDQHLWGTLKKVLKSKGPSLQLQGAPIRGL